jgi:AcrR family transcriptional regulator
MDDLAAARSAADGPGGGSAQGSPDPRVGATVGSTARLRDLKRQQTRERLERTALRLFAEHGFDNVTVEDVCREAQVGPATFYRHFGAKEEVVFAYEAGFEAALRAAVAAAREHAARHDQLLAILDSFGRYLESQQSSLSLRDSIVLGHEGLLRRTVAVQREVEARLAAGLADLRGLPEPDDAILAEAAVGLVVLRVAMRSWRAGHSDSLSAATHRAYVEVRKALGPDDS